MSEYFSCCIKLRFLKCIYFASCLKFYCIQEKADISISNIFKAKQSISKNRTTRKRKNVLLILRKIYCLTVWNDRFVIITVILNPLIPVHNSLHLFFYQILCLWHYLPIWLHTPSQCLINEHLIVQCKRDNWQITVQSPQDDHENTLHSLWFSHCSQLTVSRTIKHTVYFLSLYGCIIIIIIIAGKRALSISSDRVCPLRFSCVNNGD